MDWGEHNGLEYLDGRGEEGDGPVAGPLICRLLGLEDGDDPADLPHGWEGGLVHHVVEEVG